MDKVGGGQEISRENISPLALPRALTCADRPAVHPEGNPGDICDDVLHNFAVDNVENYPVGRKGHGIDSDRAIIILHYSGGSPLIPGRSVDNCC